MITHIDVIKAFIAKLELWKKNLLNGSTRNFPRLSDIFDIAGPIDDSLKDHISEHMLALKGEFIRYFLEVDTDDISMALTRDPFKCSVGQVPASLQEEFIDITHSSQAKDEF